MGLRRWVKRLESATRANTMTLVCPECGEEFQVSEDASLDYLAAAWLEQTGARGYRETPPAVSNLHAHAHDASLFVDKADGKPWLGEFFHGVGQMPDEVEDLSEP